MQNDDYLYDRQVRIPGWNQDTLERSIAAVIGSGELALETITTLAAIGIRKIIVIGNQKTGKGEFYLNIPLRERRYRVLEWQKAMNVVFPDINVFPVDGDLEQYQAAHVLTDEVDVIIDTTNSFQSKVNARVFAEEKGIPILSCAVKPGYLKFVPDEIDEHLPQDYVITGFDNEEQDPNLAILGAGIIGDETVAELLGFDHRAGRSIYYKIGGQDRFRSAESSYSFQGYPAFSGKNALVVGLGGIAASSALRIIARQGYDLVDLMDSDTVIRSNLNRQIQYYDAVGRSKAKASARFLRKICGRRTRFRAIDEYLSPKFKPDVKYDIIFAYLDSYQARAIVSIFAIKNKIPLIDAATNYNSAEWSIYKPGDSNCMDCRFGIHAMGEREEQERAEHCTALPDNSVITPNLIAGAGSSLDSCSVFIPDLFGEPFNGVWTYGSRRKMRFGSRPGKKGVCSCHRKKVEWIKV